MFTALMLLIAAIAAGDGAPAAGGQDYELEAPSPQIFERFRPGDTCGIGAKVELQCEAGEKDLKSCTVVNEDPAGKGFGAASLKVSTRYRVKRASGWKPGASPETISVTVDWNGAGGGLRDTAGGGCNGM
jgi:hypothetical protein